MSSKRTIKRWDSIEDATVIEMIQKYPSNFGLAFKQAGKKLGRSESSVSQHYYAVLRNGDPIIVVGSEQGLIPNKKIVAFKESDSARTRKAMMVTMFQSIDPNELIETFMSLLTMDEQKSMFQRITTKLASEV